MHEICVQIDCDAIYLKSILFVVPLRVIYSQTTDVSLSLFYVNGHRRNDYGRLQHI